jgi:hypothetical protein
MREWERIVFSSYREGYEAKLELLRFCLVQPSSVTYHLLRQSCDVLSRSRRVPICGRLRVLSPPGPIILPLLTCRRLVCRHNVHTTYYHLRTSSSRSLLTESAARFAADTTVIRSRRRPLSLRPRLSSPSPEASGNHPRRGRKWTRDH